MITHVYPFDITSGAAATLRRWAGTITWERDLATQLVSVTVDAVKLEGPSNSGLYVYWNPELPVEYRPEVAAYPNIANVSFDLEPNGTGYAYISGAGPNTDVTYRYVTGAPIVDEELPPTDSILTDIKARLDPLGVANHVGYAPTGAAVPYNVIRPLLVDPLEEDLAITGDAVSWDYSISVYCCGASVDASFNLALAVIGALQGARVRGTTLSASMGYNGAIVEGHYESQVTVQLNQGGI